MTSLPEQQTHGVDGDYGLHGARVLSVGSVFGPLAPCVGFSRPWTRVGESSRCGKQIPAEPGEGDPSRTSAFLSHQRSSRCLSTNESHPHKSAKNPSFARRRRRRVRFMDMTGHPSDAELQRNTPLIPCSRWMSPCCGCIFPEAMITVDRSEQQ
jgi:hypothetical protein